MRCGRQDLCYKGDDRRCEGVPHGKKPGRCGWRWREKYCPFYKRDDRPCETIGPMRWNDGSGVWNEPSY